MARISCLLVIALLVLCAVSCAKAEPAATPMVTPTTSLPATSSVAPRTTEDIADKFLQALRRADWEGAMRPFSQQMKDALPTSKLAELWAALGVQNGEYRRVIGLRHIVQGQYDAVIMTLQFKKAALDMRVVVDTQTGEIAGLFFTPTAGTPAPTIATTLPDYVELDAFSEQEVRVGDDEWALPGTLTMPQGDGPFPAVVLVHGSSPNDRDETIGPNKPFRDLAWGLASRGIAVLRYDKRTYVYPQQMAALERLTVQDETIEDAVRAVALLQQTDRIDPARVFVVGHSLGGMLAPRIAQQAPVAGLIILAGATRPIEELMVEQTRYILALDGELSAQDRAQIASLEAEVAKIKALTPVDPPSGTLLGAPASYWLDLRGYQPAQMAATLSTPLLILQGERDYQVTMDDLHIWQAALSGRANVQFRTYSALNHLFIAGEGPGTPQEYDVAGHVAPEVVDDITTWIAARP